MTFTKKSRDIQRTRKIFSILELPDQGKIIDVSCGGGRLLKKIENTNPNLELYGVDITPGYLAQHPELSNINFQIAEASSLPYPDNNFDVSICSLSIHHYENLSAVLSEIKRVTKPNGFIYLIDFFPKATWSQWLLNLIGCHEPYHFEKFYTQQEIIERATAINLMHHNTLPIYKLPPLVGLKFTKSL
jgi:ubiquinone/menaquinone biosynthesis C-methylase UbiE